VEVVVVTGAGGIGEAVARRLGPGRVIVLADASDGALGRVGGELRASGHQVRTVRVDVADASDVGELARTAAELGPIRAVVHTAGLSPVQATAEAIVAVDVIGTARVLDVFEPHVVPGAVAVCVASMAGTMTALDPEDLTLLATTPTDALGRLPLLDPTTLDPPSAYGIAKRANQARVEAASIRWGRRGGRVVSVSPGVVATPMGHAELAGPFGDVMWDMVEGSATRRLGSPDDIAAVVEFLVGYGASFITGTDVLVDGGVVAALRYATAPDRPDA
jgi:NAD(P)-dependent dehydrogenase (short-subunit alcohol dehydrogenase family)